MQRVNLHARPSIIQVGCPTRCHQVCALNHAKVSDTDLDYPSEPCHCNVSIAKLHLPWITPAICKMYRKKQCLYNPAKDLHKAKHWDRFSVLKPDTRNNLRIAHWNYMNSIFEESLKRKDSSIFWRYIKSQHQDSIGVPPLKRNGQLYSGSAEKASILSEQSQSAFTPDSGNSAPELERKPLPQYQLHYTFQPAGSPSSLPTSRFCKTSDPDDIPARALIELTLVFNQSLLSWVSDPRWLEECLCVPHTQEAENYHPSPSPVSKLLEHVLYHIMSHLEEYNILTHL